MKNFYRVLKLTFAHKWLITASMFCSMAVAVLWAANITAILPVVDVVMLGKSIPDWLNDKQAAKRAEIAKLEDSIASLVAEQKTADEPTVAKLEQNLTDLKVQKADVEKDLTKYVNWYCPLATRYLPTTAFRTLILVCAWIAVGTFLKSVFRVAGSFFSAQLGNVVQFELRKMLYRRVLRMDLTTFHSYTPGDWMNRFMGNVGTAAVGAQNVYGMVLREPLKIVGCLAFAAWVSWQLLLLTLISAPLAGYAITWFAKALKRANRRAIGENTSVFDRLEQTISGIKTIKAFTQESHERARFHRTSKQLYKQTIRINLYDSMVSPVTEIAGIAIIVAAILCGGYLVLNQQTHLFGIRISEKPLTHGYLTMFYCMLAGASDPIRRMTTVFNSLQWGIVAADNVYEAMDRESSIQDPAVPKPIPKRLGTIEFSNLTFAYGSNDPVLRDVNLQVAAGETIAIIGPNGCGKSTLTNLLARFYDPNEGQVKISGVDIRNYRRRDLRDRIGIVTQETMLFNETVAENILYGKPSATEDEMIGAAERAHAHRFITEVLPDGYQTMVGQGGNRLSGGQRQRIALARVILRDPDILILDEATSQIDVESERLIHEVLEEFTQDRTSIIITHRPSTLELADRIVVMDAGQIVDVGTYSELAARCRLFRTLTHLEYRESA